MRSIDNGNLGAPMERLMYAYLKSQFGDDKVHYQPGKFPSRFGVTCPDVLVAGERNLYIDVTISPLPLAWDERDDPKSDQRRMFANPKNPKKDVGVAVYQQVIMMPQGYEFTSRIVKEVGSSMVSSTDAQEVVDQYCANYAYMLLNAFDNDWEITATNLAGVLGLSLDS